MTPTPKLWRFFASMLCLTAVGCDPVYHGKLHDYHRAEVGYEWGEVRGALSGQNRTIDKFNVIRASPYELFVAISIDEMLRSVRNTGCVARIMSLKLVNSVNQAIVFLTAEAREALTQRRDGHKAYFFFRELGLDYEDYYVDV